MKSRPAKPLTTTGSGDAEYVAAFDEAVDVDTDYLEMNLRGILTEPLGGLKEALHIEALWARGSKDFEAIKGREVRAEYKALLIALERARERLLKLSPGMAAFMPVDEGVCLASLGEVIDALAAVKPQIDRIPRAMREGDWEGWVAEELAFRVLRVLKAYNVPIAATADKDFDNASIAVRILALVGFTAGLPRAETTWRDILMKCEA